MSNDAQFNVKVDFQDVVALEHKLTGLVEKLALADENVKTLGKDLGEAARQKPIKFTSEDEGRKIKVIADSLTILRQSLKDITSVATVIDSGKVAEGTLPILNLVRNTRTRAQVEYEVIKSLRTQTEQELLNFKQRGASLAGEDLAYLKQMKANREAAAKEATASLKKFTQDMAANGDVMKSMWQKSVTDQEMAMTANANAMKRGFAEVTAVKEAAAAKDAQINAAWAAHEALSASQRSKVTGAAFNAADQEATLAKKRQIDAMWKEADASKLAHDTAMVQAERALMEAHERDVTSNMNSLKLKAEQARAAEAAIAKSRAASLALAQAPTYGKLGGYEVSGPYSLISQPTVSSLAASRTPNMKDVLNGIAPAASQAEKALAGVSSGINRFTLNANDAHSAARGLAAGFGGLFLTWGAMVPLLAGSALSYGFSSVLKGGAEFQHQLMSIQALSEESTAGVNALGNEALKLGRVGPYGPLEIAKAMKTLSLAGLDASKVLEAIPTVKIFALAGDTSIERASEVLTTVGTAYGISANNYLYVSDVISKAAAISRSSIEGMSESFKTASSISAQYGVSLENTAKGLALLANVGVDRSSAGTALRNFYADLAGRSKQVEKTLKDIGLQTLDAQGHVREFSEVMLDLLKITEKYTGPDQSKIIDKIFGERGGKEANAVLTAMKVKIEEAGVSVDQFRTQWQRMNEEMANSAGFSTIAALTVQLTPLNQAKSVMASLQTALTEAFTTIEPQFLHLTTMLQNLFSSEAFRAGLSSVASTLMSVTEFAVEHGRAILNVVIAYQALRGVMTIATDLTAVAVALKGVETAAAGASVAAGLLNKVVSYGNPIMAALSAILTVGAAAWALWKLNFTDAKKEQDSYAGASNTALLESLKTEAERLENVNAAREKGITLQQQEAAIRLASFRNKPAELVQAEKDLLTAKSGGKFMGGDAVSGYLNATETSTKNTAAIVEAQTRVNKLYREWDKQQDEADNYLKRINAASKVAQDAAIKQQEEARKRILGSMRLPGTPDYSTGRIEGQMSREELSSINKGLADQEKYLKDAYDNQLAMLENLHKNKLISEGTYQGNLINLTAKYELDAQAARDKALANEAAEYIRRREEIEKTTYKNPKQKDAELQKLQDANTAFVKKYLTDTAAMEGAANRRMTIAMQNAEGALQKVRLDEKKFWAEDTAEIEASAQKITWAISKQDEAMQNAAVSADRKYGKHLADLALKMEEASKAYEDISEAIRRSSQDGGIVSRSQLESLDNALTVLNGMKDALAQAKVNASAGKAIMVQQAGAQEQLREYYDMAGRITDAIVNGSTEGMGAVAKNLRKVIEQEFVRQWITIPIRAVIGDIMGLDKLSAASGGVGGATGGSAGSALGIIDSAGKWSKTMSTIGNLADSWNGAGLASLVSSQTGFNLGLSTAATDAYGLNVAGGFTPTATGSVLSNLPIGGIMTAYNRGGIGGFASGVGSTALAGGVSGMMGSAGFMGGATGALSAIPGWGWAALAVAAILGMGKGEYVKSWGESSTSFDKNGKVTDTVHRFGDVDNTTADNIVKGFNATYISTMRGLGISTAATTFSYGANNSDGGKFRTGASVNGKQVYDSGEIKADDASMKLAASRAVLAAVSESDLPKYLTGMFDNVDFNTVTQEAADGLMSIAKGAKSIHELAVNMPLNNLTNASFGTIKSLAELSGGIENLQNNVATYYKNFYDSTGLGNIGLNSLKEQFETIGVGTLPTTREEFKKLVEAQDLSTEAGRAHAASLYALAGAYADLVPNIASMNTMLGTVGGAMFSLDAAGQAAANGLAAAAGGLANLQSLVGSFQSGYFTQAEQRQMTVASVTSDLNAAGFNFTAEQVGAASRADIRAAVVAASQNVATPEGQKQYVAALKAAQQLDQSLPKLEQAVQAAAGGGGGGGGAVNSIKDAWKSIVDALWGEVSRIKGLIEETGPDAYAAAQARFAIQTAAARAGDQNAAKALPATSQALLKLAETNTKTLVELKLMQGSVMTSLTDTATQLSNQYGLDIPKFDVGTNIVPRDMIAMVHAGEAIVPKAYNPALGSATVVSSDNSEEIALLREELRQMRLTLASINSNTDLTARRIDNVTQKGKAMLTETLT